MNNGRLAGKTRAFCVFVEGKATVNFYEAKNNPQLYEAQLRVV